MSPTTSAAPPPPVALAVAAAACVVCARSTRTENWSSSATSTAVIAAAVVGTNWSYVVVESANTTEVDDVDDVVVGLVELAKLVELVLVLVLAADVAWALDVKVDDGVWPVGVEVVSSALLSTRLLEPVADDAVAELCAAASADAVELPMTTLPDEPFDAVLAVVCPVAPDSDGDEDPAVMPICVAEAELAPEPETVTVSTSVNAAVIHVVTVGASLELWVSPALVDAVALVDPPPLGVPTPDPSCAVTVTPVSLEGADADDVVAKVEADVVLALHVDLRVVDDTALFDADADIALADAELELVSSVADGSLVPSPAVAAVPDMSAEIADTVAAELAVELRLVLAVKLEVVPGPLLDVLLTAVLTCTRSLSTTVTPSTSAADVTAAFPFPSDTAELADVRATLVVLTANDELALIEPVC
ncbi:hypothetical protein Q5752_000875 [Cryptotrichosporon argae]